MMKLSKNKSIPLVTILLAACGSGGASSAPPSASLSPTAFFEARVVATTSGAIPTLDRTTSLLGTDADNNGVRDDIDAYINSLPDTPVQKKALIQIAASFNEMMAVDLTNQALIAAAVTNSMNAARCNGLVYGDVAYKHSRDIEKYVFNTKERFVAYMKFGQAMSGKAWPFPTAGSGCAP